MGRYTSVQVFTDQNTKVIAGGYKIGESGSVKPAKIDKVETVTGSCAGAGSEQFHIYRAARRRELDRLEGIETRHAVEEAAKFFAEKVARNKAEADERTRKNAEKRKRKKTKQRGTHASSTSPDNCIKESDVDSDSAVHDREALETDSITGDSRLKKQKLDPMLSSFKR